MCYEAFSNGNRDIVLIHDFQGRQKEREKWAFTHTSFFLVFILYVVNLSREVLTLVKFIL